MFGLLKKNDDMPQWAKDCFAKERARVVFEGEAKATDWKIRSEGTDITPDLAREFVANMGDHRFSDQFTVFDVMQCLCVLEAERQAGK